MLQIAEHIMEGKTADFDPAILEDRYRTALVEILRTKKREMPVAEGPVQPSAENVINLMDALRRSMESERPAVAKLRHCGRRVNRSDARRTRGVEAAADVACVAYDCCRDFNAGHMGGVREGYGSKDSHSTLVQCSSTLIRGSWPRTRSLRD